MQLIIHNNANTPNKAQPEIYKPLLMFSSEETSTSFNTKQVTPPTHNITAIIQTTIPNHAAELNQPRYFNLLLGFLNKE